MTTRNMPPQVVALLAEMRGDGRHDEADDIEARWETAPAAATVTADDAVKIIEAETEHDVAVIEASADAAEQTIDAQADAAASEAAAEAIDGDDDDDTGDVGQSPEESHWFTRSRDGWKAGRS